MKRKYAGWIPSLAAVLCLISVLVPLRAGAESFSSHFSVRYQDGEGSVPLRIALIYSHENGNYYDGILHFMPLKEFLEWEYDAPVVAVNGGQLYQVDYDVDFFDRFSFGVTFYEPTEEGFVRFGRDDGQAVTPEDLAPGDWLMAIDIHAEKGDEYFSGAGFIHIVIPGGEGSVWPVRTPTPATPTPGQALPPAQETPQA